MFWRKTRAAIDRFHPAHRQLTLERTMSMSSPPGEWATVLAGLSQHAGSVRRRRWMLPERTTTVLVPLIHVLSEDAGPDGVIAISVDLRGAKAPGKDGPRQDLPVRHPVRRLTQWFVVDPWLRARAELRDGSVLEVDVADRIRHRKIHKVNPRGKHKWKTKKKTVQRISARRILPPGAAVRRPDTPPPPWIAVRTKQGKRTVLAAAGKRVPAPAGAPDRELRAILAVLTELFRWTRPDTTRRTA